MKFVMADTEIQIIPKIILDDATFKVDNKIIRRGDYVLNRAKHGKYIEKYFPSSSNRVGRPDIPFMFVRMMEESIIKDYFNIDYSIHTKEGFIIERRDIYNIKFYEDFLDKVAEIMMTPGTKKNLSTYIKEQGYGDVYVFHPNGENNKKVSKDALFIIGGFAEGDFISNLSDFQKIKVYKSEITVPAALELIHFSIISSLNYPYILFSSL